MLSNIAEQMANAHAPETVQIGLHDPIAQQTGRRFYAQQPFVYRRREIGLHGKILLSKWKTAEQYIGVDQICDRCREKLFRTQIGLQCRPILFLRRCSEILAILQNEVVRIPSDSTAESQAI